MMRFLSISIWILLMLASPLLFAQDYAAMKRDFDLSLQQKIENAIAGMIDRSEFSTSVLSEYSAPARAARNAKMIDLPKMNMAPVDLTSDSLEPLQGMDFTQMIRNVVVIVRTKNELSGPEQQSIRGLLAPILKNAGGFKNEISFEKLPSISSALKKENPQVEDKFLWQMGLGLLVLAACFGGLSLAVYLGSKNMTNHVNVQAPASADPFQNSNSSFDKTQVENKPDEPNSEKINEKFLKTAVLRWKKFVDLDPRTAAMGISRWAMSQDEVESRLSVYACSVLSLSTVKKLISFLDPEVKQVLNSKAKDDLISVSASELDMKLLNEVNSFLFEENTSKMSAESYFVDFTPQEIALLLKMGNKYSKLLTQHLNPLRLTRSIQLLSPKEVGKLFGAFQDDASYDENKLAQEARDLILEIRKSRPSTQEHPLFKLLQTLKDLNFEQEEQIYQGLIEFGTEELVQSAAVQTFPNFLFDRLSLEILKQAISSFQLNDRVEILLCIPEPLKDRIFLALESQSKLSDALKAQIYDIKNSPAEYELVLKNKEKITRAWSTKVQRLIKSSEVFKKESLQAINSWYLKSKEDAGASHAKAA